MIRFQSPIVFSSERVRLEGEVRRLSSLLDTALRANAAASASLAESSKIAADLSKFRSESGVAVARVLSEMTDEQQALFLYEVALSSEKYDRAAQVSFIVDFINKKPADERDEDLRAIRGLIRDLSTAFLP